MSCERIGGGDRRIRACCDDWRIFILPLGEGKCHWLKKDIHVPSIHMMTDLLYLPQCSKYDCTPSYMWKLCWTHFVKESWVRKNIALFPLIKDFCQLCGCSCKVQYGSQACHIETENLFQPLKQKVLISAVLERLCENVEFTMTAASGNSVIWKDMWKFGEHRKRKPSQLLKIWH